MSNAVSSSSSLPTVEVSTEHSIIGLILQADLVVQSVMLMLVLASVFCWSIIFEKYIHFKRLKRSTMLFEKSFWSGQRLDELYDRIKGKRNQPMAAIFVAAMNEWTRKQPAYNEGSGNVVVLRTGIKERIFQAMSVAQNRSMGYLEKNLGFLATVGSAAPFIGLFGTVWGIMNSFQSIGVQKSASLVVVAPGISEALLATAIGLFAAIPAVIYYNIFSEKLNQYYIRLEDFTNELGALLTRKLDEAA